MKRNAILPATFRWAAGATMLAGTWLLIGCNSMGGNSSSHPADASESPQNDTAMVAPKGGAELWAENCGRCHNTRSPSSYSDLQWEVAVHHMRLIANLTGEQQRSITEFLKSAN